MTIEQIEKHKEVICWFCDNINKGVWCNIGSNNKPDWCLTKTPKFNTEYTYVINDKYVEFRKAIKEGKTLEYKRDGEWISHTDRLDTWFSPKNIRIKPEEPKFKVGDWIRQAPKLHSSNSLPNIGIVGELKKIKSKSPLSYGDSKWVQIDKSIPSSIFIDIDDANDTTYSYELWRPKKGEVVWVWDNEYNHPYLATFLTMDGGMYCTSEKLWDNCEPFIGKLPSFYTNK